MRLSELLSTGHGYMGSPSFVPLLLGLVFAAELVGVGWVFAGSVRRSLQRPVPAWAFALLPMLGFTLQEFLERWLSGASFPWWMVLQPTFRVGLLLQVPFALVAFLVARLLLRAADRAGAGSPRRRAEAGAPRGFAWLGCTRDVSASTWCAGERPLRSCSAQGWAGGHRPRSLEHPAPPPITLGVRA